jgi:hypothetical protein
MINKLIQIVLFLSLVGTFSCRKELGGVSTRSDFFVKFIGDTFDQDGNQVIEGVDGSLYLIGTTTPVEDRQEIYLVKTGANGDVIWTKTFSVIDRDCLGASLQFTNDGGLILVGSSIEKDGLNSELLLIKTDIEGEEIWREAHKVNVATKLDYATYVHVLEDGTGYLLLGYSEDGTGNSDIIWAKTSIDGKVEGNQTTWYKIKDGVGFNEVRKVIEWRGTYVLVGSSTENPDSDIDQSGVNAIVFVVYPNGNLGPKKTFGGTEGDDYGYDIKQLPNGDFVVLGSTISQAKAGGRDVFIVELEGTPISDPIDGVYHTFGTESNEWGYSMSVNDDNSVTACGKSVRADGIEDMFIFKTNSEFDQEWLSEFKTKNQENALSIIKSVDGGYVTTGAASIDKNKMISLIKTTANGELK